MTEATTGPPKKNKKNAPHPLSGFSGERRADPDYPQNDNATGFSFQPNRAPTYFSRIVIPLI